MISQLKMLSSCNPAEKISEGFFWSSSVENKNQIKNHGERPRKGGKYPSIASLTANWHDAHPHPTYRSSSTSVLRFRSFFAENLYANSSTWLFVLPSTMKLVVFCLLAVFVLGASSAVLQVTPDKFDVLVDGSKHVFVEVS